MIDIKSASYGRSYFENIQKIDNPERKAILEWDLGYLRSKKRNIRKILDVGCGLGEFLGFCDGLKIETHGLEHSKYAINLAKGNTKARLSRINAGKQKWPYRDGEFDAVCAFDLLEHVKNSKHVLSESFRLLKPGGVFLATTPNGSAISQKLLPYDPTHINVQGERYWRDQFLKTGFSNLTSRGCLFFGIPPSPVWRQRAKNIGLPVKVGPVMFPVKKICGTLYMVGWKRES